MAEYECDMEFGRVRMRLAAGAGAVVGRAEVCVDDGRRHAFLRCRVAPAASLSNASKHVTT